MKIAIFGANGRIGSRIVNEALNRGHEVTALVRKPQDFNQEDRLHLKVARADLFKAQDVESGVFDHDAVVCAYNNTQGAAPASIAEIVVPLTIGMKYANVKRLLIVGGAGSLITASGVQLVETPEFPAAYKATALAHRDALNLYKKEVELKWTYLSPAAEIMPGDRTGIYRTGTNQLLLDADGKSFISMEDYAIAVVDELENPLHIMQQFTVAY